ncbi:MAG TPA: phosphatase PAP2 family protein, partial [Vicinamibacterales bacterium]|nr:phosphatase PAP2 family protein [Vicinamibacterales bacterium]
RWLLAVDHRLLASAAGRAVTGGPRAVRELLELGYLAVYPMVPAAFGILLAQGLRSHADRFWTTVLTAEFVCYILLPLLPTRPPRQLELEPAYGGMATRVRRLNLAILNRASNQWNTFPSGHVAGAAACALTLLPLAPAAGLVLAALTCLIMAGAVAGRYHYLADALGGLAVAVVAASLIAW